MWEEGVSSRVSVAGVVAVGRVSAEKALGHHVQKHLPAGLPVHSLQHRQQAATDLGQEKYAFTFTHLDRPPLERVISISRRRPPASRRHTLVPFAGVGTAFITEYTSPHVCIRARARLLTNEHATMFPIDMVISRRPSSTPVRNGHIKRITDGDIQSSVLEIMGTNVSTTFVSCPADSNATLGIKLPFLVMIIKNLKKYFSFEVMVLDDKNVRRRFRASNYQVRHKKEARPGTISLFGVALMRKCRRGPGHCTHPHHPLSLRRASSGLAHLTAPQECLLPCTTAQILTLPSVSVPLGRTA